MTPHEIESRLWHYRAVLLGWTDGDTFSAEIDQGFNGTTTQRLRLIGSAIALDTPELRSPDPEIRRRGMAAKNRAEGMLPPGSACYVVTKKHAKGAPPDGAFGRYLAQLLLPDGTNVGDALLAEGHAEPYRRGNS